MANRNTSTDEILARLRQGFYPYYDRDNSAFYWDRDYCRAIVELNSRTTARAKAILADITEGYQLIWNGSPKDVLTNLQDEKIKEDTWVNEDVRTFTKVCWKTAIFRPLKRMTCQAYFAVRSSEYA